jgi:CheY-like chemotaxis protein
MTGSGERRKVLFVDDDPTQLLHAEQLLKSEYEVVTVKSGQEALDFLYNGFIPHLILLDILMPEMDGWEAYNRIRDVCHLRNVPIVFVTSVTGAEAARRGLEMGAADYITKPYNKTDLMKRVKSALTKNETAQIMPA